MSTDQIAVVIFVVGSVLLLAFQFQLLHHWLQQKFHMSSERRSSLFWIVTPVIIVALLFGYGQWSFRRGPVQTETVEQR